MGYKLVLIGIFLILLSACSGRVPSLPTNTPIDVSALQTSAVQTAIVDLNKSATANAPSSTPKPTKTPNPTLTSTQTLTPAPSNTPGPTLDQMLSDKKDGSYMVGTEISAGIWRSSGGVSDKECPLTIKSFSGDLEGITYDLPGGTIRIPSGEHIVYIGGGSGNKCVWSFLQP